MQWWMPRPNESSGVAPGARRVAGGIEAIGIGEARRVAVGREHRQADDVALAHRVAVHLEVAAGGARDLADRRLEPEQLLDRLGRDTVIAQHRERVVVLREVREVHRQRAAGRVERAEQQVHDHRDELVAAQAVTAVLRRDQVAQQVVARHRRRAGAAR